MLTQINQEIYELKEKLLIKGKLESSIKMLNDELDKKRSKAQALKEQLESELKDVEKLEGISFSSLVFSLLGKKEERLAKEKEEYLSVKLKYDDCLKAIKELENELSNVKNKLKNYEGLEDEYNRKIAEKKEIILRNEGENSQNLRNALDRINDLKIDIKEVREAIYAGARAYDALNQMEDSLEDAKGWGTWDMLGGGLISNMAKHSAIDKAKNISHDFQYLLKSFVKELEDVNEFTNIEVNISSFLGFADFFFDGFFVDWYVQSKINDSLDRVREASHKVESIIQKLKNDLSNLEKELKEHENYVNQLLES
jgi:prefoldin subunit 5